MTPADIRRIRSALSEASGRDWTLGDLALQLGTSPDVIRRWEDGSEIVPGLAEVALKYLSKGLPGFRGDLPEWSYQAEFHHRGLPEHADIITRYWWPRFAAPVVDRLKPGGAKLGQITWFDDPCDQRESVLGRCREAFALHE
jgi:hypothetical protein